MAKIIDNLLPVPISAPRWVSFQIGRVRWCHVKGVQKHQCWSFPSSCLLASSAGLINRIKWELRATVSILDDSGFIRFINSGKLPASTSISFASTDTYQLNRSCADSLSDSRLRKMNPSSKWTKGAFCELSSQRSLTEHVMDFPGICSHVLPHHSDQGRCLM